MLPSLRRRVSASLIGRLFACRFGGVWSERTFLISLAIIVAFVAFGLVGLAFEEVFIFVLDSLSRAFGLIFG